MHDDLIKGIVELKRDEVAKTVSELAEKGEDPQMLLEDCRKGMSTVGDLFQQGDYYLAELLLSAEIFKQAMSTLEPYLAKGRPAETAGRVLLATLKGDIHDLGKNILGYLLKAQGFEVHDLGVDVIPDRVIEKVKEIRPDFVGFSALITPTFERMKDAAEMLTQEGMRNDLKLMIGGGITTPDIKDYIGADFQSVDAMAGVAYCMQMAKGE